MLSIQVPRNESLHRPVVICYFGRSSATATCHGVGCGSCDWCRVHDATWRYFVTCVSTSPPVHYLFDAHPRYRNTRGQRIHSCSVQRYHPLDTRCTHSALRKAISDTDGDKSGRRCYRSSWLHHTLSSQVMGHFARAWNTPAEATARLLPREPSSMAVRVGAQCARAPVALEIAPPLRSPASTLNIATVGHSQVETRSHTLRASPRADGDPAHPARRARRPPALW